MNQEVSARLEQQDRPLPAVFALSVAVFPGVLSTAMLSMGIVQITEAFGVTFQQFQIRNSVFFVVFASCVLLGATVASAIGERRSIIFGQLLFIGAAIASSVAQDWKVFVVAQALMAAADGLIVPALMNLLRAMVREERLGWAFGWFEGILAAAALAGPLVGALLISQASWRYMFGMLAAIAAVVFALGLVLIPREAKCEKQPRPPLVSVMAFAACVVLLQLLLSSAGTDEATRYALLLSLCVAWFVATEVTSTRRRAATLIPWQAFAKSAVVLAVLRIFLVFIVSNAFTLHAPAALSLVKSLPLEAIGTCFTLAAVVSVVLQPIAGRFADRYERAMIVAGLLLLALGAIALTMLTQGIAAMLQLALCLVVMQVGSALFGPAQLRVASLAAPAEQRGPFMGFYMFVQFVSGAFAASLLGPVVSNSSGSIDDTSFNRFLWLCAALLIAALLTVLLKTKPRSR
jgi:DHA2 family metal-tetracycline-proton antiporter-like MFS transporter